MFSSSIFSDLLKPLDRREVGRIVDVHGADRWRKSFRTWDHLVAMLAAQFSGAMSLRDVEVLLGGEEAHHYHLHCGAVRRSTLADANRDRSCDVFRDIAGLLLGRTGRGARGVGELLTVLDSSPVSLTGRGHDWALATQSRAYSSGLKLHVQFTPDDGGMDYVEVTGSNVNDITAALDFPLEGDRLYVFDKGYCDYNWWHEIGETGAHFVTRLKHNAAFEVIEDRSLEGGESSPVIRDQLITLTNRTPRAGKVNHLAGIPLRLVEIRHPAGKGRPFRIVTNSITADADTIAGWYKQRWSIELLFKWLKQNLRIRKFIGESRNAIMIQIHVAIIAYLLLKAYQRLITAGTGHRRLKDIALTIRTHLFSRPGIQKRRRKRRQDALKSQPDLWDAISC